MEARINELKKLISETEESLKDSNITSDVELVELLNEELSKAKTELEKLEAELVKASVDATDKLDKAKESGDKKGEKKAKAQLSEIKSDSNELEKLNNKLASTEKKVETAEEKARHGGHRKGAGRKPKPNKEVKPKGKRGGFRPNAGRKPSKFVPNKKTVKAISTTKKKGRMLLKPEKALALKKSKEKSVKAFGQTVVFKSDAEFCSKLIKAFKKRRAVYKSKKKRTKPVFGIITSKVKDAVSKGISNVSSKEISKNPKQMIGKFQRLESKAIEFLDAFKDILGSDYKKSEISKEFGDIDNAIKNLIKKYKGK